MLFKTIKAINTLATLTAKKAQEIYVGLQTKDANRLFLEDNIPTEYTVAVEKEINRLESEMVSKMSGSFIIEPAVPATYTEEGEIDEEAVPAVYYTVTTEKALKEGMSSEILDIPTLVTDVRIWSDGNPDQEPSWTNYKSSFNS